jgi:heterodisulfide reductase subunit B
MAEAMGLEIASPGSGCCKNLRVANEALKADAELRAKVSACLPRLFQGSSAARHPLYIILDDVGLEALAKPG